jgi:AraC-like DNA-binding protein
MIQYIEETYSKYQSVSLDRVRLLFGELLLYLNEILHLIPEDNSKELLTSSDRHIYEIVNFINKEYINKITLDALADRFFISKYYLCRMFKKTMGLSIIEFINTKRISETAFLLQNTNKAISEIAISVGFNSQAFFIKLFKRIYGMTPMQYRKRHII